MLRIGERGQLSASRLFYLRHRPIRDFIEEDWTIPSQDLMFNLRVQAAKL